MATTAALLPPQAAAAGATAATSVPVAMASLPASDGQHAQLRRAADVSVEGVDVSASAWQLRNLHGADDLGDAISAPSTGRDLLMKRKKGRNDKKNRREKRARRAKKGKHGRKVRTGKKANGKKGKRGKRAGLFPPTPKGESNCTAIAVVEEVEVYHADFLHASASAPQPSCLPLPPQPASALL